MSVFSTMLETIYRNRDLGADGTYYPAAGGSSAVRVMSRRVQAGDSLLDTGATVPGLELRVRKVDVEQPVEGDELELADGRRFRVRATRPDALGLVWDLDVDPVTP